MKFIGIGSCVLSVFPIEEVTNYAVLSEKHGLHSFWVGEGYHYFRNIGDEARSATTTVAAAAAATDKIKLGLAIIPPYTRHPGLVAMEAFSLNELSKGRFMMGIGAAKAATAYLGMKDPSPVKTFRECVEITRRILSGQPFKFEGKVFSASTVFESRAKNYRDVPILLGATGNVLLELAGSVADGVILPTFTSPAFVKHALEKVRLGASKVGKSLEDFPVGATLHFSVSKDGTRARNAVREAVAVYVANKVRNIQNDTLVQLAGLTSEEMLPIAKMIDQKDLRGATSLVTDEMMDKVAICGTPEECIKRLKDYVDAGLNLPFAYLTSVNSDEGRKETIELAANIIQPALSDYYSK
ncbi:MAG: LLM class flavin-dependent oxidoreductase [Thaumarchaeota archaeon]|nr:LLM class flavin-dependent oxidoreductase [Nitrososphaerota archaeon]